MQEHYSSTSNDSAAVTEQVGHFTLACLKQWASADEKNGGLGYCLCFLMGSLSAIDRQDKL